MFSIGTVLLSIMVSMAVFLSFNTLRVMLVIHSNYINNKYDGSYDIALKIGMATSAVAWGGVTVLQNIVTVVAG